MFPEEAMRVFVTGGTGLIGRRLIPVLARRGYRFEFDHVDAAIADLVAANSSLPPCGKLSTT
jgi:uncharacterized protein YbjT (DUF2867 family)